MNSIEKLKEIEKEALTNFVRKVTRNMISEDKNKIIITEKRTIEYSIDIEKLVKELIVLEENEDIFIDSEIIYSSLLFMRNKDNKSNVKIDEDYSYSDLRDEGSFILSPEYLSYVKRKKREYVLSLILDDETK